MIPGLVKESLDDTSLQLTLKEAGGEYFGQYAGGKNNPYKYQLFSVPFRRISTGKVLVLLSNRGDYVESVVEKDIRLLYGLMTALLAALALGLFILYKYITREAELVRLKTDFVDSVSHTLKTPLTRMTLLAENVQRGWVTEENQKTAFLQTIVRETTLMNEMIDNMLDFSRIEAGKKQYYFQVSSLPDIVQSVVERYAVYLEKNGFELNVEILDELPPFELDREAVALIIANLLQNAVKYTDREKEKYIAVRVCREKESALIEVQDRGMGIADKDLPDIFKKFYRVPGSEVKAREGSGLGLFIARHAAAAHNGDIRVKSQIGKGSTFTVRIPIEK
jgi:signal transduction histidine kinase